MLLNLIQQELKNIFIIANIDENEATISVSKRLDLCEYQCNSLFKLSKTMGLKPLEIGNMLVESYNNLDSKIIESCEFCMPGFLNIKVSQTFKNNILNQMYLNDILLEKFNEKNYVLDYGGPNVAKPLHVGHLRAAVLGESLKRMIKYTGGSVVSDVHLGDYGLQIGQVILGLKEENLDDLSNGILFDIKDLERIYPVMSGLCKSDDEKLSQAREITMQLQNENAKYNALFEAIVEISVADIKQNYDKLDVSFDLWYGESHSFKYINDMMEKLETMNIVTEDANAKIVKFAEDKYPVFLVGKSDGSFLYSTSDLATIVQRVEDFNPDEIVYAVDARQALHFNQVFEVCKLADIAPNTKFVHAKFGTMNGTDNKPFKTREGGVLKLEVLFDMVEKKLIEKSSENNANLSQEDTQILVNSVVKFADLQNFRETNYIFELDRFTEFSGKTGPYILYTAVRINKIINMANIKEDIFDYEFENEYLKALQFKILNFDLAINSSMNDYSMHHLCEYVFEVATLVNSFYQSVHILSMDDELKKAYVVTNLKLAYKVLEHSMEILGIKIPSKM